MLAGSVVGPGMFWLCGVCRSDSTVFRFINEGFAVFVIGFIALYWWRRSRPRPSASGLLVAEVVGLATTAAVVLAANSGIRFPSLDGLYGLLLVGGFGLIRATSSARP
jgi:hypothetical protein